MNYSDIGGNVGISADNVYYFDGINVTDRGHRHLRRQPQHRDHPGTAGDHRRHSGRVRRRARADLERRHQVGQQQLARLGELLLPERQPGGRERARRSAETFSTKDSAFTFGGPVYARQGVVLRQLPLHQPRGRRHRRSTPTSSCARSTTRSTRASPRAAGRSTNADLVSFTYLSDPTEVTGRRQRDITNARDRAREQGGHRYSGNYTRVWGDTLLEIGANKHNGEVTDLSAIRESRNDVLFQTAPTARVLTDEQVGGFGRDLIDQRDNKAIRGIAAARLAQPHLQGRRRVEPRRQLPRHALREQPRASRRWPDKYRGAGITAAQIAAGGWSGLQFDVSTTSDFNGLIRTIDAQPRSRRVLLRPTTSTATAR